MDEMADLVVLGFVPEGVRLRHFGRHRHHLARAPWPEHSGSPHQEPLTADWSITEIGAAPGGLSLQLMRACGERRSGATSWVGQLAKVMA